MLWQALSRIELLIIFREQRTYVLFGSSINPSSQQIKQLVRISSKFLCRLNRISRCEAKNSSLKTLKAQMALLNVFFFICRVLSQANREPQNSETYLWWACWTGWWCCWRADGQMEELAVDTDTTAATRILVEENYHWSNTSYRVSQKKLPFWNLS